MTDQNIFPWEDTPWHYVTIELPDGKLHRLPRFAQTHEQAAQIAMEAIVTSDGSKMETGDIRVTRDGYLVPIRRSEQTTAKPREMTSTTRPMQLDEEDCQLLVTALMLWNTRSIAENERAESLARRLGRLFA